MGLGFRVRSRVSVRVRVVSHGTGAVRQVVEEVVLPVGYRSSLASSLTLRQARSQQVTQMRRSKLGR